MPRPYDYRIDDESLDEMTFLLTSLGWRMSDMGRWGLPSEGHLFAYRTTPDGEYLYADHDSYDLRNCPNCSCRFHLYDCHTTSVERIDEDGDEYDEEFCSPDCAESHESNPLPLLPYSTTNPTMDTASQARPFRFGIEVEKEDSKWRNSRNLFTKPNRHNWIIVRDGSLDSYVGFELVSPCYNFSRFDEVKSAILDMDVIDANCNKTCGGHITVSKYGRTGEEFANEISDFFPLLFAMYPNRLKVHWSEPRKKVEHRNNGIKYRAVNVRSEAVELRIFPRIKNRQQLISRLQLVQWGIDVDHRQDVKTELLDKSSWLRQFLGRFYNEQRLNDKIVLYKAFRDWHDNMQIHANTYRLVSPYISQVSRSEIDHSRAEEPFSTVEAENEEEVCL